MQSSRTAAPMTAQGPRKGEPSSCSMRNGLPTQPARLVRGSSRRIMSMRFRPANIRVINRRASSSAVIRPAVENKKAGLPPARGKPAFISNRQTKRLDGSLHIRTRVGGCQCSRLLRPIPGHTLRATLRIDLPLRLGAYSDRCSVIHAVCALNAACGGSGKQRGSE